MKRNHIITLAVLLSVPFLYAGAAKISGLTALTAPAVGDKIPLTDVSDTTQASTGTAKYVTVQNLLGTLSDSILSVTTLPLNADGNTTIFTVPSGKTAVLTRAVLVVGADAGSTDITFGQAGALTDFLGTQQCDNADAANDVIVFEPVPNATPALRKAYAAGTLIKAVVANQAGGAINTLYLFGFLY